SQAALGARDGILLGLLLEVGALLCQRTHTQVELALGNLTIAQARAQVAFLFVELATLQLDLGLAKLAAVRKRLAERVNYGVEVLKHLLLTALQVFLCLFRCLSFEFSGALDAFGLSLSDGVFAFDRGL